MEKYIGIPFLLGGRTKEGCDCYGLLRLFYMDEFGIDLPEYNLYKEFDSVLLYTLIDTKINLLDFSEIEIPEFGDVGLFKFYGLTTHLGIYIGKNRILHIMRGTNAVIEKVDSPRLRGRFHCWYRRRR